MWNLGYVCDTSTTQYQHQKYPCTTENNNNTFHNMILRLIKPFLGHGGQRLCAVRVCVCVCVCVCVFECVCVYACGGLVS